MKGDRMKVAHDGALLLPARLTIFFLLLSLFPSLLPLLPAARM